MNFPSDMHFNQLWSLSSPLGFFFSRIVSVYVGSNETAQLSHSDTIRESFYAVPLQKYDANAALELLSGLLVVEYFWAG